MIFSGCSSSDGPSGKSNANSGGKSQVLDLAMPEFVTSNNSSDGTLELKELEGVGEEKVYSLIITDSVSGAQCTKPMALTYKKSIVGNEPYKIVLIAPDEGSCTHKLTFKVDGVELGNSTIDVVASIVKGEIVTGLPLLTQAGESYPVEFRFENISPSYSATEVTISEPPSDFTEISNTCKSSDTIPASGTCSIQGSFASSIGKNAMLSYTLSYFQGHDITLSTRTAVSPRLFVLNTSGMVSHYNLDESKSLINEKASVFFAKPTNITLSAGGKKVFLVNLLGNMVSHCDVDITTANFLNCADTGGEGFKQPSAVTFTADGKKVFVANAGNSKINRCDADSVGNFLNCTSVGPTFKAPHEITLTADEKRAFVVNAGDDTISRCDVNLVGDFSNCSNAGGIGFYSPESIALTADDKRVFVANRLGNTVSRCDVDASGDFSNCSYTGGANFADSVGIALIADDKKVFVTNRGNNIISRCDVDKEGDFSNCRDAGGSDFNTPSDIAFMPDGKIVFIVNNGDDTVSRCDVDVIGDFSNCIKTAIKFSTNLAIFSVATALVLR